MPKALIFTDIVLSPTQTFVQSQVAALQQFTAQFVGLSASPQSLPIAGTPILMTNGDARTGYWRKEAYKWVGIAPAFHKRVRDSGGDLIHAHFGENATAAMWLANATKLPLVLSLHGGAEILPDSTLRRERYNLPFYVHRSRLWKRVDLFLCVSEFVRQKAIAHGFPPEKLHLHYTGIDCTKFQQGADESEKDLVVFVGRLVRYKAADHLLQAMQIVRISRPGARCVLIGDGPLRQEFEELARSLHLDCTFLGHQPPETVREWIRRATVFCAPSRTSMADGRSEALGHVFLEAQAMRVPVVSYRHGGIPEAVLHGQTGLLAEEGDVNTLATSILRYLEDPEYRRETGDRGAAWVRTHFNIDKQNVPLEQMYSRLCEERRSALC
jgi:glycosyltransferase involved in cell wall biosynthesis